LLRWDVFSRESISPAFHNWKEVARIDRIKGHNVAGLGALMSDDHTSIDALGN